MTMEIQLFKKSHMPHAFKMVHFPFPYYLSADRFFKGFAMLHISTNRGPWKNGCDLQCIIQCIHSIRSSALMQYTDDADAHVLCIWMRWETIVCMHESFCAYRMYFASKKQVRM